MASSDGTSIRCDFGPVEYGKTKFDRKCVIFYLPESNYETGYVFSKQQTHRDVIYWRCDECARLRVDRSVKLPTVRVADDRYLDDPANPRHPHLCFPLHRSAIASKQLDRHVRSSIRKTRCKPRHAYETAVKAIDALYPDDEMRKMVKDSYPPYKSLRTAYYRCRKGMPSGAPGQRKRKASKEESTASEFDQISRDLVVGGIEVVDGSGADGVSGSISSSAETESLTLTSVSTDCKPTPAGAEIGYRSAAHQPRLQREPEGQCAASSLMQLIQAQQPAVIPSVIPGSVPVDSIPPGSISGFSPPCSQLGHSPAHVSRSLTTPPQDGGWLLNTFRCPGVRDTVALTVSANSDVENERKPISTEATTTSDSGIGIQNSGARPQISKEFGSFPTFSDKGTQTNISVLNPLDPCVPCAARNSRCDQGTAVDVSELAPLDPCLYCFGSREV